MNNIIYKFLCVFFLGLIECFCLALNTKFVVRNKRILSFITSFINIMIWAYIVTMTVENMGNFFIIATYGIGFGIGDVLAIQFDKYLDIIVKLKGLKFKKRKKTKRERKK